MFARLFGDRRDREERQIYSPAHPRDRIRQGNMGHRKVAKTKLMPDYFYPRAGDSPIANRLRNILAALHNLKTQSEPVFPGWAIPLSIAIRVVEDALKVSRNKLTKKKR